MEYVAIDFETTSFARSSACSVGLVRFDQDGRELDSYYSLIRPRLPMYNPVCMNVHQIPIEEIEDAPTFPEIWDDMRSFIGSSALVAHNAPFDISVLKGPLEDWGLSGVEDDYYCTLSLARILRPDLESHKLTFMANNFGWIYDAHMALSDAMIAGRLFKVFCSDYLADGKALSSFMRSVYRRSSKPFPRHLSVNALER